MNCFFFTAFRFILLTLGISQAFALSANDLINDELAQAFVLETRRIDIPNFRGAFNPSIIRWNNSFLLSFRIRDSRLISTFQIGLVLLDEDFNLIGCPQILDVRSKNPLMPRKEQDPRLLYVADQLYMVYSNEIKQSEAGGKYETRRVFVAKMEYDGEKFVVDKPECLYGFEGEREKRWEKNWVPFDYNGNLLLAYSLAPHRILHHLKGTGTCETLASTKSKINWNWGHLRGGTPALQIDEDHYLSFFHSSIPLSTVHSNGKEMLHYFMGAYIFKSTPPFSITGISPEPIVAKKFYSGPAYKTFKPLRVVFPGGFIFDDKYIWVAYGRQDHEIWIVKLDKQGLLDSLVLPEDVVN
jgi:predicted GH43/DUF377 family glycosyl hydrolase